MESDEDLGTKTELAIDVGWMADGDVELESKPLGGGKRGRRRGTLSSANSKYSAERLAKETPEKRAVRLARMRDYAKRRREESKDLKEKSLAHGSAEHYVSRSDRALQYYSMQEGDQRHGFSESTFEEQVVDSDFAVLPSVTNGTGEVVLADVAATADAHHPTNHGATLDASDQDPAMYSGDSQHAAEQGENTLSSDDNGPNAEAGEYAPDMESGVSDDLAASITNDMVASDHLQAPAVDNYKPGKRKRSKRSFEGETPEQREFRLARMRAYNHRYTHFIKKGRPVPEPVPDVNAGEEPADNRRRRNNPLHWTKRRTCAVCRHHGHNRRTCPTFLEHKAKAMVECHNDEKKATNAAFLACAKELDNIRPKVSRTANGSSEDPSDSLNAAETGSRKTPPAEETAVAKHPVTAKAPQAGQSPGFVQKEYTLSQTGRLSPQSRGPRRCRYCGGLFHDRRTCPKLTKVPLSYSDASGKEYSSHSSQEDEVVDDTEELRQYSTDKWCRKCRTIGHTQEHCQGYRQPVVASTYRNLREDDPGEEEADANGGDSYGRQPMNGQDYDDSYAATSPDSCPSSPSSPSSRPSRSLSEMAVGITGLLPARCTFCHKAGHNRRTCALLIAQLSGPMFSGELSEEDDLSSAYKKYSRRYSSPATYDGSAAQQQQPRQSPSPTQAHTTNNQPFQVAIRRCTNCKQTGHNRRNCVLFSQARRASSTGRSAFILPAGSPSAATSSQRGSPMGHEQNYARPNETSPSRQCSFCKRFGHDKRLCPHRHARQGSPAGRHFSYQGAGRSSPANGRYSALPRSGAALYASAAAAVAAAAASESRHTSFPPVASDTGRPLHVRQGAAVDWPGRVERMYEEDSDASDGDTLVIDEGYRREPVKHATVDGHPGDVHAAEHARSPPNLDIRDQQLKAARLVQDSGDMEGSAELAQMEKLRGDQSEAGRYLKTVKRPVQPPVEHSGGRLQQSDNLHGGEQKVVSTSGVFIPPRKESSCSGLLRERVLARVEARNAHAVSPKMQSSSQHGSSSGSRSRPVASRDIQPPRRTAQSIESQMDDVIYSLAYRQSRHHDSQTSSAEDTRRLVHLLRLDSSIPSLSRSILPGLAAMSEDNESATCDMCSRHYNDDWYEDGNLTDADCEWCVQLKELRSAALSYHRHLQTALTKAAYLRKAMSSQLSEQS